MITVDYKAELKIKGEYLALSLAGWVKKGSEAYEMVTKYAKTRDKAILGHLRAIGAVLDVKEAVNIIPTTGRTVLAMLLAGDTTYSGEINYGAFGTAVSPVFTNASTKLVTEVYRKQATSQYFEDNIAYIDWFIEQGDVANQTFTEFGAFIDGTAAADSGQAWSLLATSGWVKSGAIYVSAKYTIN